MQITRASVTDHVMNKPKRDLSIQTKKLTILAVSSTDRPTGSYWWKWFIPSFYEDFLMDKTFGPKKDAWSDNSKCQLRLFGVADTKFTKDYHNGGVAAIRDLSENPHFTRTVECWYMSAKDSWTQDKVFLRYAIYCPIMATDLVDALRTDADPCTSLNSNHKLYDLTLYPTASDRHSIFNHNNLAASDKTRMSGLGLDENFGKSFNNTYRGQEIKTSFSPLHNNQGGLPGSEKTGFQTSGIACVVQTFQNPSSGYNMWMFTKYHSSIGLTVVIYDRFGLHYEFVKDLIDQHGVVYHDYTPIEILHPQKYNRQYAEQQGSDFKFFYGRDKAFDGADSAAISRPVVDADNALQQDVDKQITFDVVRLNYDTRYKIVFLDSDELLAPSQILGNRTFFKNEPAIPVSEFPIELVKERLYSHWGSEEPLNEEYQLYRMGVAAFTPSRVIHVMNVSLDGDMILPTQNCMRTGYDARNMSAMMSCWSDAMVKQTWNKFMDPQGTCPFHWVHKACMRYEWNKRPKGEHMTPTNVMKLGAQKKLCFCGHRTTHVEERYVIVHLSHFQYCLQHRFWVKRTGVVETTQNDLNPMAYLLSSVKA